MSLRGWYRAFRDAFRSMTQSSLMSLASMGSVMISLVVLSVVLVFALNLEHAATSVEQQVEVKVYLCNQHDAEAPCNKQELNAGQKQGLLDQITKLPGVAQATFHTKSDALEQMKTDFPDMAPTLTGYQGDDNPLSDTIVVKAGQANQVEGIARRITPLTGVRHVEYGQAFIAKLLAFTMAVRWIGISLAVLLLIATLLTISNTIRLAVHARRREIGIMKLVGATDWYIQRPFLIEGVCLGLVGALVATGLVGLGYEKLVLYVNQQIPFLPLIPPNMILGKLTTWLGVLGVGTGAIGSLISIRRYLRV